jgi:cysteine-rich repeat protein
MQPAKLTFSAALLAIAACSDGTSPGLSESGTTVETETSTGVGESGSASASESTTDTGTDTTDTTEATTMEPPMPFCGDGNVDPGEECDDGNDNDFDGCLADCTQVELIDAPPMEWTYYEIPGTRCMNGSTAGFAVNYNPNSTNVMIYLEGGGACFSDACDFTAFNIPFVPPIDGIFSRSNDNNPVNDWTMIYVPYCTGDIHAGDAEAMLGGQLRQFRGYSNITRYLQQWVPSFPAERVLLTGISAGGFGAALNSTQVADAYGDQVELTVIDDSGPPLSNAVIPPCLQQLFRATWNLDGTVLGACPNCDPTDFATGFLDHALTNYPDVRFAVFSNTSDAVIGTYMGAGWGNGQYDNCDGFPVPVPALTYAEDLFAIRALNEQDISTMYVLGIGHTVLRVGFNVTSANGTSVPEWIADVLAGQITHVGP